MRKIIKSGEKIFKKFIIQRNICYHDFPLVNQNKKRKLSMGKIAEKALETCLIAKTDPYYPNSISSLKINLLIVLLLTYLTVFINVGRFEVSSGIDFYQYWGVGKAQEWSPATLKSPSAEQEKYAAVLNAYALRTADLHLVKANEIRRKLQLNQTPLCYSIFTFIPSNFSLAFGMFQIIQGILFLSAISILSAVYFGDWLRLLPFGLFLTFLYGPVVADSEVGNLNFLYLFGFALLLLLSDRILVKHPPRRPLGASMLFMSILVFLALLKPSWALVILLLAIYLRVAQGTSVFASAAAVGLFSGAIFIVLPCIQFHSWKVWQDWYHYLKTWDGAILLARIPQGNYSPALLFSRVIGSSYLTGIIFLGFLLTLSLFIALMMAKGKEESFCKGMARAAIHSFADPHLVIAAGVTMTLLLSYFGWYHYYTLSLLPAVWLISPRHPWRWARTAGIVSLILTANIITGTMRLCFGFTYLLTCASATIVQGPMSALLSRVGLTTTTGLTNSGLAGLLGTLGLTANADVNLINGLITVIGLIPLWLGILTAIAASKKTGLRPSPLL